MLVSKHAAELCAHIVNDLSGELPARILAVLFSKGRSTIAQLAQHTSLPTRHLRHGLAVLVQQNLLYYHAPSDTTAVGYEANPDACYNLIRSGKVLDMVRTEFGPAEHEVVQTLLQLGHARISDLVQAFGFRGSSNGHATYSRHENSEPAHAGNAVHIATLQDLHRTLARLIIAEIIDQVGPKSFRNPDDVYREIADEVTKTTPGEKSTAKSKEKLQQIVVSQCHAAREESKKLKRQLNQTMPYSVKRRRVGSGGHGNGSATTPHVSEIDPNIVLKINFEKCLVDLRNHTLSQFAADSLGETTGQVYLALLRLLSEKTSRCRSDARVDSESGSDMNGDDENNTNHRNADPLSSVTSIQIFEALDPLVDVCWGLGKASRDKIHTRSAEKIRSTPKNLSYDSDESDGDAPTRRPGNHYQESEEEDDSEEDNARARNDRARSNGKAEVDDGTSSKGDRFESMRQHLLLLSESEQGFVRHCGTQGRGQWTVDFHCLMNHFRRIEVDAVIEQTFGRHGLRLTRILRARGKLDEKTLPSMALMKKQDVQGKMLALQMAGFVDIQEVPRDNSRTANRTMFFWYFDEDRVRSQLLDDLYKTILRCLQTLDVHRHRERHVLSFVERKDVQGKEEEVMTAEHYNKYSRFMELQGKLLGHVMRLDEVVSVVKDY